MGAAQSYGYGHMSKCSRLHNFMVTVTQTIKISRLHTFMIICSHGGNEISRPWLHNQNLTFAHFYDHMPKWATHLYGYIYIVNQNLTVTHFHNHMVTWGDLNTRLLSHDQNLTIAHFHNHIFTWTTKPYGNVYKIKISWFNSASFPIVLSN